jgi:hypothetical protein
LRVGTSRRPTSELIEQKHIAALPVQLLPLSMGIGRSGVLAKGENGVEHEEVHTSSRSDVCRARDKSRTK